MASAPLPQQDFPSLASVYECFTALTAPSTDLGGSLLLYANLDSNGIALAIAANIAGAASLGLESDLGRAKSAIRSGVCDFLVNHLDEALRILKNEIRKRKSVSVALVGDIQTDIDKMIERGVQPDRVDASVQGAATFIARGAQRLETGAAEKGIAITWSVAREPFRWLPRIDALAIAALSGDAARRRWLEASPRYVGRTLANQRYVRMSASESDIFLAAVHHEIERGEIPVPVTLSRDGDPSVIAP